MPKNNNCIVPVRRPRDNIEVSSDYSPSRTPNNGNLSVVLLGGNIPYGMRSFGPYSLLKIGTKTILDYQIETIRNVFGDCEIMLVAGYMADKVIKRRPDDIRIIENQLFENSNECEQIRLSLNSILNTNVLFITGNLLFNEATLKIIDAKKNCLVYETNNQVPREEIGLAINENKVTSLSFAIDENKWCNVAYFTNKTIDRLRSIVSDKKNKKMFMFEIIDSMLEKYDFYAMTSNDVKIRIIDCPKDLRDENTN